MRNWWNPTPYSTWAVPTRPMRTMKVRGDESPTRLIPSHRRRQASQNVSAGDFTPKLVRLVFEVRDNESCFYCGQGLLWHQRGMSWSAHHRKPRGAGGTSNPEIGKASNCVILCGSGTTGCHGWVETHRALASEYGLLVSTNGVDRPADIPVRREDGSWWWLTNWGSAIEIDNDPRF